MMRVYQVPHQAFGWLIAGTLLASLPHLWSGPVWLQLSLPLLLGWRVLAHQGRLSLPGRNFRVLLLLGAVIGTFYTHGTILGPEAGTCLLVAAFGLKMLETFRFRDARVVVVLGYFVLATAFLFGQGPLLSLYVMAVMMMLTAALIGLHHPRGIGSAWRHLRLAAVMMLQALPLMVVLFVLVPRIEPLWSLQMDEPEARTGMSDSVSPGDIGRLSESDEVAFRVRFEQDMPDYRDRYWRGLTLSRFDGRTWSRAEYPAGDAVDYDWFPGEPEPPWLHRLREARRGEAYSYQVILERTGRSWLFALSVPFTDERNRNIGMSRDMRLVHQGDINQRLAYNVRSYPGAAVGMALHERERRLNLRLPGDDNPRARERARALREQAESDHAFAESVLRWFNEEEFYYTLRPSRLGSDHIDEFLFSTRRGFCEHYASAYAFLMRAAGIPARLVAGYQGGEMNPLGNYMRIHQYDAHAWVEIWLEPAGWVRVDPTAAVAPERIEFGLERALEERGEARGSAGLLDAWGENPLLQRLGNLTDYVQFAWQRWILSYDRRDQLGLFEQWFGGTSLWRVAVALGVMLGIIVLPLALWILVRRPRQGPLQREYHRVVRWLARRGIQPHGGETPRELVGRAAVQLPGRAATLRAWGDAFESVAYGARGRNEQAWRELRRAGRALRWAIPGRSAAPPGNGKQAEPADNER